MWGVVASDIPLILGTVVWLVFLEGLLSADNALVLAVMVRHLPRQEQRHALRYGIWGAFIFRLIAVILSTQLMNFWQFQVVGGLYLLYLAASHFLSGGGDEHDQPRRSRFGSGFWATVVAVELADIAFSIDSIVAAVAMAPLYFDRFWRLAIVYVGGILGIITMRFVAGYFILLLEKFDGLVVGAYVLVGWIGVKLIISGLHKFQGGRYLPWEMPEWIFWTGMIAIVLVSMFAKPRRKKKETEGLVEVGNTERRSDPEA
jgi:YkoY family integral membrane protein